MFPYFASLLSKTIHSKTWIHNQIWFLHKVKCNQRPRWNIYVVWPHGLKKIFNNSCNCVEFSFTSHVSKTMLPLSFGQKHYIIA